MEIIEVAEATEGLGSDRENRRGTQRDQWITAFLSGIAFVVFARFDIE